MKTKDARSLAERFAQLHRGSNPLVLVNAWDAWSANVCEAAGHQAVATSSFSIAESLGFKDGQNVPLALLLAAVETISRSVSVPITVDFEAGFGDTPQQIGDAVGRVIEAGAIGINIEDGLSRGERVLVNAEQHCEKIAQALAAANQRGLPLFINARFDGVLLEKKQTDTLINEAIRRARLYQTAGASGLFVPGLTELPLIQRLARSIDLPLNIMMMPGGPSVAELASAGVSRVSLGPWPFEYVRRVFRRTVTEFADQSSAFFA
ncbi:2-methylisocitrate lyase-like PEP mutase family enzyme [Bradyrhizobium japonicum]|uniref:isocitrate lyase/PEP mutase family protein n=1 Tax=Bradyrhizobium TaxID=374 RepID=UPI0003697D27|nr:isocitrate lyase/phosphoenolpyruvate mutase family protein [Bradyrhizobium elkanii]MCP1733332.1 2-methylisocitrate lyase-like PEP mutase family enzyme [Bradyrhizobium elkanii]MCS3568670.1 2-methylisocitrate lyase-like PEP mutase family enzyme [Bradyrhizobium elkanii]MCS3589846.1 2-methylisocitrate lyase-like PEP mutase family enzyme [Bradyrhizobium elkanii]MCS3619288.1 2-methylisocitrate lyase-like PEP mutase family enzyme [Bradyrhizobium elkanii]MCS3693895.1 2-methylisocitrate lyase-like P